MMKNKFIYKNSQIVILSSHDDSHVPFVSKYFEKEQVVLIDPQQIVSGVELSYQLVDANIEVTYKGTLLNNVAGVWFRRPVLPNKKDIPVPDSYKEYSYDGVTNHIVWLFDRFEKANWISNYYAMLRADNKLTQISLARKLGFLVPDTLLTSSPKAAELFLKKYPVSIIKTVSSYGFGQRRNGEEISVFFYSQRILRTEKIDMTNLHLAPAFFQQSVENIMGDIRVNVVGNKTFAAIITNPGFDENKQSIRDWRVGHESGTLKIESFDKEFSKEIAKLCIAYVHKLGLNFGAIDLILDKNGKYWFLEINPNGQWAFVEEITKQHIGEEIAYFLLHGENK